MTTNILLHVLGLVSRFHAEQELLDWLETISLRPIRASDIAASSSPGERQVAMAAPWSGLCGPRRQGCLYARTVAHGSGAALAAELGSGVHFLACDVSDAAALKAAIYAALLDAIGLRRSSGFSSRTRPTVHGTVSTIDARALGRLPCGQPQAPVLCGASRLSAIEAAGGDPSSASARSRG